LFQKATGYLFFETLKILCIPDTCNALFWSSTTLTFSVKKQILIEFRNLLSHFTIPVVLDWCCSGNW